MSMKSSQGLTQIKVNLVLGQQDAPIEFANSATRSRRNNETFTRLVFHRLWPDELHRHRDHDWDGGIFSQAVFIGNNA